MSPTAAPQWMVYGTGADRPLAPLVTVTVNVTMYPVGEISNSLTACRPVGGRGYSNRSRAGDV